ncbi:ribosomal protein S6 modification protein [Pasteurellaceae bacterium Macca]|nr:ribosomal protein S6 modification protein [Pasteurellaceae bacterium Macca]
MKFLILCREPRLYSCQRLQQAAEKRGIGVDILDPNRFLLKLNGGTFQLYYQEGEHYQKHRPKGEILASYQGILPRFGTASTTMGCHVLRHWEMQNIAVLNRSEAFILARDKWQSLQVLQGKGIPTPDTLISGELYAVDDALAQYPLPSVIKTLSGSQGVGVMLAEGQSSALSLLETLSEAKIPTLLQRFIQEAKGEDIRAFVVGNRVVASMQRLGCDGEFRANIHRGGKAISIELSEAEQRLAVEATRALGLDVAGVDLIRAKMGTLVLEVNASPGLEMIETVSGVDIAGLMIEALCQKRQLG